MKTLVIHPKDPTTDFLKVIYKDIDHTLIDSRIPKSRLKVAIRDHDRVIILGHGTDKGLFDPKTYHNIIDSTLVYLLRDKLNSLYIWCNADVFVNKYGLHGFYTGMIISDSGEAYTLNVTPKGDNVDVSNKLFASTISKYLDVNTLKMKDNVIGDYILDGNPIVDYNKNNIYHRD